MRKTGGLEVTDHVKVILHSTEPVRNAAERHDEFIRRETLAESLEFTSSPDGDGFTEWKINGESTAISVVKV